MRVCVCVCRSHPHAQSTTALQGQGVPATDDTPKFDAKAACRARVLALFTGKEFVPSVTGAEGGPLVGVVLDRTAFYAEGGGQVADVGELQLAGASTADDAIAVVDTQRYAGYVLHSCRVPAALALRVGAELDVFEDLLAREPIQANHTATHILNHALRRVLGDSVDQKGSLVDAERARFDFSHKTAVTDDELARAEDAARAVIDAGERKGLYVCVCVCFCVCV